MVLFSASNAAISKSTESLPRLQNKTRLPPSWQACNVEPSNELYGLQEEEEEELEPINILSPQPRKQKPSAKHLHDFKGSYLFALKLP